VITWQARTPMAKPVGMSKKWCCQVVSTDVAINAKPRFSSQGKAGGVSAQLAARPAQERRRDVQQVDAQVQQNRPRQERDESLPAHADLVHPRCRQLRGVQVGRGIGEQETRRHQQQPEHRLFPGTRLDRRLIYPGDVRLQPGFPSANWFARLPGREANFRRIAPAVTRIPRLLAMSAAVRGRVIAGHSRAASASPRCCGTAGPPSGPAYRPRCAPGCPS
jgi:hypothetical protein